MPDTPAVDILIPTLNEAANITAAVENARALGNVFVLDSHSTDGTQDLARAAGAHVVEHTFINYADQKNWGLRNLPFTGSWVFILDADERITPKLRREILDRLKRGSKTEGYFVNRLPIMMGRPIRHGGLYPSWNLRLFKRGRAFYEERSVHEHMTCGGPTDYLDHEMLHIRNENLHKYIEKHIVYAEMESEEWLKLRQGTSKAGQPSRLFTRMLRVRGWLRREVWPRIWFRPQLRFLYMYVLRFGFLDGRAGLHLAQLMAAYEYTIGLLYQEKRHRARTHKAGDAEHTSPW